MRTVLAKQEGERKKFSATFSRLGKRTGFKGYSEETILLKDVRDFATNKIVTEHLWFVFTKGFQKVATTAGMKIEFEARVKEYTKGYVNSKTKINNQETDFRLSHPTKIKVV